MVLIIPGYHAVKSYRRLLARLKQSSLCFGFSTTENQQKGHQNFKGDILTCLVISYTMTAAADPR